MVDRLLVERILNDLRSFLNDLENVKAISYEEFHRDTQLRRFIERTLHIAIEAVIDIAQHLIADEGWREADSYRDTFIVLQECGVISDELLSKLIKMAAFRNLLVHYYEKIDDEIIFGVLKKNLKDFEDFCGEKGIRILRSYYLGEKRVVKLLPNLLAVNGIFLLERKS